MSLQKRKWLLAAILGAAVLSGCASNSAQEQAKQTNEGDPRDPFESVNRVSWDFNQDVLDAYILRPVTIAYVTVMPQFARTGLVNAANNLEEPVNFFNNLFQGKVDKSMDSMARFVINTTVGLLGVFDVAGEIGIAREEEDFGEVLGVWGVDTGPYLMIPALGPNDPRSLTGDVVDNFYSPMSLLSSQVSITRFIISAIEARASLLDQEQQLEQSSDDYIFVKNAYFQNLEYQVTDGKSAEKEIQDEDLQNFDEFESMLEGMDFDDQGVNDSQ